MPKVVRISENKLVDMIDKIVAEVVENRKVEWLNEQKSANNSLVESKLAELEAKINKLSK
jgi:hypothetical protein